MRPSFDEMTIASALPGEVVHLAVEERVAGIREVLWGVPVINAGDRRRPRPPPGFVDREAFFSSTENSFSTVKNAEKFPFSVDRRHPAVIPEHFVVDSFSFWRIHGRWPLFVDRRLPAAGAVLQFFR